jgi:hypothetical protein
VTEWSDQQLVIREFLKSYADRLVPAGITVTQFCRLAQSAYMEAALSHAISSGKKVNQSAMAVMTGLPRSQIRDFLKGRTQSKRETDQPHGIERLIAGWCADDAFATAAGRPKKLTTMGERSEFARLVKKYGPDVSPKALLREMVRLKYAKVVGEKVMLASITPITRGATTLRAVNGALQSVVSIPKLDDAELMSFSLVCEPTSFAFKKPRGALRTILERRVEEAVGAFVRDVEGACNSIAVRDAGNGNSARMATKMTVLVFENSGPNDGEKGMTGKR